VLPPRGVTSTCDPPLRMARAWGTLFEKHRLSQEDLLAAVETVYDQHGNGYRPMAADIIGAARAIRQDRAMREPLAIEAQHDDTERGEGYLAAMLAVAEIGRRIDGDTSWPHRNAPPGPLSVVRALPLPAVSLPSWAPLLQLGHQTATQRPPPLPHRQSRPRHPRRRATNRAPNPTPRHPPRHQPQQ